MSTSEKGDAVIKLVGGALIGVVGNILVDKLNLPEPWQTIVSAIISGCGVLFFMILLDKIDIFSIKAEKRRDRILEIFNERIKDIKEASEQMDFYTIETLKNQRTEFENITSDVEKGFENNNIDDINDGLERVAKFMGVELEYSTHEEFLAYSDGRPVIEL